MASIREIRQRIGSLKNIEKITRAVKMVSVAKMRRAYDRVVSLRPYAKALQNMLGNVVANTESLSHPLIDPRERKNAAVIVAAADGGLCGAFNTNIMKLGAHRVQELQKTLPEGGKVYVFCVGKKANEYYSRRRYLLGGEYVGIFQFLQYGNALEIVNDVVAGYTHGKFDSVDIVYSEFRSATRQNNTVEQMLPIPITSDEDKNQQQGVSYIYEPDSRDVFERLLPKSLNMQMWKVLLETNASYQSARMIAMENATKNAGELITNLSLIYNKARQSAITKEILEIVSGAEALKGA